MKPFCILASAFVLAACATAPVSGAPAMTASGGVMPGELHLGDWRTADAEATLAAFEQNVARRYIAGLALSDATGDLARSEFDCGAGPPVDQQGRGDPPAQVCRRTIVANGCTHAWQVHLFDRTGAGALSQVRALYDRRCGEERLLGGPG